MRVVCKYGEKFDELGLMIDQTRIYEEMAGTDPKQAKAYWAFVRHGWLHTGTEEADFNAQSNIADQIVAVEDNLSPELTHG